jgi:hypothetical protein
MMRLICLIFLMICLLSHCAPAPKAPEPESPSLPVLRPLPPAETPAPAEVPAPEPANVAPSPAQGPETQPYVHEVRWSGETLSHIALWYTGDQDNMKKIEEMNPGLKSDRIFIGDKILIPAELLKTRKPMPREYIRSAIRSKKTSSRRSPPPTESPEKMREDEMFGPVETSSPPDSTGQAELFGPVEPGEASVPARPAFPGR